MLDPLPYRIVQPYQAMVGGYAAVYEVSGYAMRQGARRSAGREISKTLTSGAVESMIATRKVCNGFRPHIESLER